MDEQNPKKTKKVLGTVLLLFAFLTSPLLCCSGNALLTVSGVDFGLNFFASKADILNNTPDLLTLTPITTTYGKPQVINQFNSIRQRDFPVKPGQAVTLQYDAADSPLAGIVVCKVEDCRLMQAKNDNSYQIDSFDSLPALEPGWLEAVQVSPVYSLGIVLLLLLGLIPVALFFLWIYLGKRPRSNQ